MKTTSEPVEEKKAAATTCPFCGTATSVRRQPEPEIGSLALDEFETIVRGEWRRRVRRREGPRAYRRPHPRALIRALIVYALQPDSPVRGTAVDELLWSQIAILETWGLNRRQIRAELLRLSQAIWDVLSRTELEFDRSRTLMEQIDRKLLEVPGWPD